MNIIRTSGMTHFLSTPFIKDRYPYEDKMRKLVIEKGVKEYFLHAQR